MRRGEEQRMEMADSAPHISPLRRTDNAPSPPHLECPRSRPDNAPSPSP